VFRTSTISVFPMIDVEKHRYLLILKVKERAVTSGYSQRVGMFKRTHFLDMESRVPRILDKPLFLRNEKTTHISRKRTEMLLEIIGVNGAHVLLLLNRVRTKGLFI